MIWDEIVNISKMKGYKTHQLFQEEIQKAILAVLSREGVFNDLVLQGGTSLRLFYDNPRFSEDLDFVMREGKKSFDLTEEVPNVKKFIKDVFPFVEDIKFDIQKNNQDLQRLVLRTISEISEQKLRIHIELAYVPSYYSQPKILSYPPLNPAVRVEDSFEILADKIIALGARPYLKGRDIWDVHFLIVEKQIIVPWDLIRHKSKDYKITYAELKKKLVTTGEKIRKEGTVILSNEMKRFLPKSLLNQYCETFDEMVKQVAIVIEGENKNEG